MVANEGGNGVQAEWEPDELIDAWTLTGNDWDLIANKAGVTRLGFAVMLKFYEIEGRFPAYPQEVPPAALSYLGSLVKVDPALFAKYSWAGRSIKYHRSQIREVYGTRPPTEDDEDRWAQWLAAESGVSLLLLFRSLHTVHGTNCGSIRPEPRCVHDSPLSAAGYRVGLAHS